MCVSFLHSWEIDVEGELVLARLTIESEADDQFDLVHTAHRLVDRARAVQRQSTGRLDAARRRMDLDAHSRARRVTVAVPAHRARVVCGGGRGRHREVPDLWFDDLESGTPREFRAETVETAVLGQCREHAAPGVQ